MPTVARKIPFLPQKASAVDRFWKYDWGFTLCLRGTERLVSILIYTDNKRTLRENIKRQDLKKK